ncbi:MAG: hypothetical protein PVI21_04770 [Candidatus Woesebacteria bacterium]|jgi:hypothetical protein
MKKDQSLKKFSLKTPISVVSLSLAITVSVVCMAVFVFSLQFNNPFISNPAKDAATPIEKSLLAAGATKVCDNESNGTSSLNTRTPYYSGYYQLNVGKDQAIEIVKKVAADNEYNLERQDDLSYYYYDSILNFGARKPSTYGDLAEGDIELGVSLHVNTDRSKISCSNGMYLIGDDTHTAISLGISLPERKK